MQKQGIYRQKSLFNHVTKIRSQLNYKLPPIYTNSFIDTRITNSCHLKATNHSASVNFIFLTNKTSNRESSDIKSTANENIEELLDDDEVCPVECVREFYTDDEFLRILEKSKESNALIIVDFYRTSCGSCKYIEQGFLKLCKGSGDKDAPVVFLKHNVIDEYDEQSEVADRLRIKTVPLFHFYKNGVLLEAFATRDKERILGAILKYTAPAVSQQTDSVP